jgi:uncharacterized protein YfaS (alpha-2-macroglobulin family)
MRVSIQGPLTLMLLVALAACGSAQSGDTDTAGIGKAKSFTPAAKLTITLDRTTYAVGDTAEVTVDNAGPLALFAIFCDGFVEGLVEKEWWTAYEPDCSTVRVRPTRLATGDSISLAFVLPLFDADDLEQYVAFRLRLRYQHEDNAGYRSVYSKEFEIGAP